MSEPGSTPPATYPNHSILKRPYKTCITKNFNHAHTVASWREVNISTLKLRDASPLQVNRCLSPTCGTYVATNAAAWIRKAVYILRIKFIELEYRMQNKTTGLEYKNKGIFKPYGTKRTDKKIRPINEKYTHKSKQWPRMLTSTQVLAWMLNNCARDSI